MFYAHSMKYNRDLHISEVRDFSDTFVCLNPECKAEFVAAAINSDKVAPHFQKRSSTDHVKDCPCDLASSQCILESPNLEKKSIEQILRGASEAKKTTSTNQRRLPTSNSGLITRKNVRVSTTRQLLNYCLSNKPDTIYEGNMRIKDFFIDSRNVAENLSRTNISGTYLLLGETIRYSRKEEFIKIKILDNKKKWDNNCLEATIYTDYKQVGEISNYIYNTFGKVFKNHPIAILANWESVEFLF